MSRALFLDVETSGFSKRDHAICQIAGIIVDEKYNTRATFDMYIKPYGKIYTQKAFEINNLSEEFLEEHGHPIGVVYNEFADFMFDNSVNLIIGHNIGFDRNFLVELIKPYNAMSALIMNKIQCIDTLKQQWPSTLQNKRLETICEHYGIEFNDKHNAMADSKAVLELCKLNKIWP